MKTYTVKPGDTIVAKVDGIERTCHVSVVGEKVILVIPLRTHRYEPYSLPLAILPSDIISITSKVTSNH